MAGARSCGTRVRCDAGRLWITEEGCLDDIVLDAGTARAVRLRGDATVRHEPAQTSPDG